MPTDQKITRLIEKLTRATATSALNWMRHDTPSSLKEATEDRYPIFLIANYKDQLIALAERRYPDYNEEFGRTYWASRIVLMFLDPLGINVTWDYEEGSPALYNLFGLAKESAGGVDQVISRLLDDD